MIEVLREIFGVAEMKVMNPSLSESTLGYSPSLNILSAVRTMARSVAMPY